MSKKEIDAIKSQIGNLRQKLAEANKRLELAEPKNVGLEVGDRILVNAQGGEVLAVVTGWGWCAPRAMRVKKDGRPSKRSVHVGPKSWRKAYSLMKGEG